MFCSAQDWHKLEKLGPWGKASVPALGSCWAANSSGLESYCFLQLLGWAGTSWAFRSPSELSVFWVAHLCFTCYVRWFQTLGLAYTFCIHISYISSRHQMLALWDIFTNWYISWLFSRSISLLPSFKPDMCYLYQFYLHFLLWNRSIQRCHTGISIFFFHFH